MMPFILILIPVLFAASPLFGKGFIPTHDGEYHIIRFWQYFTMLSGGTLFPRWAPDLNYGLGIPLFTFQYPFPNLVGALFHVFGFSFVDSVKLVTATGYLCAAVFCYLWLREKFGAFRAVAGTLTGAFVPYWFLDIYIRGSIGEVWAFAFVFATLFAVAKKRHFAVAVSVALLIVSHNIMAMVFVPILVMYAYLFYRGAIVPMILGVGMACVFWLPALFEQRFIRGLSNVNVFDYFPKLYQLLIPSWGSGFRGQTTGATEMSYQIGIVPIAVFFVSLFSGHNQKDSRKETRLFQLLLAGAVVLMLPVSAMVWHSIVPLALIQYPWRLLAVGIVAIPFLSAVIAKKNIVGLLLVLFSFLLTWQYFHPVIYEPRTDGQYFAHEQLSRGTSSLGDAFQTTWITADPKLLSSMKFSLSTGTVSAQKITPIRYAITVTATESGVLHTPIAHYPGWQLTAEKRTRQSEPDANGLASFAVFPGSYTGEIALHDTWWQRLAVFVSVLSLSVAFVSFILKK